jgi:hypothetical protein
MLERLGMSAAAVAALVVQDDEGQDRDGQDLLTSVGMPEHNRRLTDKILAAFNHAYSVDEKIIAAKLHAVLVECQVQLGVSTADRRTSRAVSQADLWVKFVQARDAYRMSRQQPGADPAMVTGSLDAMKEAYRRWSAS